MAKSSPKSSVISSQQKDQQNEVTRLDERLYRLSVKAARSIQRFRLTIVTLICLVVLAFLGNWAYQQYDRYQQATLSADVHRVLADAGGVAGDDKPDPLEVLSRFEELVGRSRGGAQERWVVKQTVVFLVDSAREQIFPPPTPDTDSPVDQDVDAEPKTPEKGGESEKKPADSSLELLERAEQLIVSTGERFPGDTDIQMWAEENLRAIRSLREWKGRAAPARSSRPILPPPSGGDTGGEGEGARETEDQGPGNRESESPAPGETSADPGPPEAAPSRPDGPDEGEESPGPPPPARKE